MRYWLWLLLLVALPLAARAEVRYCPANPYNILECAAGSTTTGGGGGGGSGTVGNVGTLTNNRIIIGAGGTDVTVAPSITGLVLGNGGGAPSAYAGTACTNQFMRSLSAAGAATCNSVSLVTDVTGTLQAAQHPALTGDVTSAAGSLATTIAPGAVTNSKVTDVAATKLTGTLQAGQFPALTGNVTTTAGSLATTIAAGAVTNAMLAGSIDLATKVTGALPAVNGGTGLTSAPDDAVITGTGTIWQARLLPNCTDTAGQHLNYDTSSNTWICGTSTSGITAVTALGSLPADELIAGNGGTQIKTATMPLLFKAEDTSTQFSITATQGAVDYLEVQAGLAGIGATLAAASVIDSNVDLGLVAQGTGCINLGNGELLTPTLRACGARVSIGAGEASNLTSTTTATMLSVRSGALGTPDTASHPPVKVERTLAIDAPINGDGAEELAGIVVNVRNVRAGDAAQPIGLYASAVNSGAHNAGIVGSGDAGGIYAVGVSQQHVGYGGFFFGQASALGAEALGVEAVTSNQTGAHINWNDTDARPAAAGLWINAYGPHRSSSGIAIVNAHSQQFDVGVGIPASNPVRTASFRDAGNATTSLSIAGTHTYALDVESGAGSIRTANSLEFGTSADLGLSRGGAGILNVSSNAVAANAVLNFDSSINTTFTLSGRLSSRMKNGSGSYWTSLAYNILASSVTAGSEASYATFQLTNAGSTATTITYTPGGTVFGAEAFPDASAIVDVVSTTKGFLPSRMTTTQRDAISSPAEGLIIYNTTTHRLNVRDNSAWKVVTFD